VTKKKSFLALKPGPHGQYLLRASEAENGMVAARARSVTARLKISRFLGVRTCNEKNKIVFVFIKSFSNQA
jgi:hypothetical protein